MTKRAWILVASAYAIGALGLLIALTILEHQQDRLDSGAQEVELSTTRLNVAAAAYCEAVLQPDAKENEALDQLSRGTYSRHAADNVAVDPVCKRIVARLQGVGESPP